MSPNDVTLAFLSGCAGLLIILFVMYGASQ